MASREEYAQRIEQFAHEIPFDELFSYIEKVTGLQLQWNLKFRTDRYGDLIPSFESNDVVDSAGWLKLIFKSLRIASFNSAIAEDRPHSMYDRSDEDRDARSYPLYYWCTVAIDYDHHDGGSNGKTFLSAQYRNGEWNFMLEQDRK